MSRFSALFGSFSGYVIFGDLDALGFIEMEAVQVGLFFTSMVLSVVLFAHAGSLRSPRLNTKQMGFTG